ncbi:hypothetical protein [Couchioplanes caeruleus]|nr:hypothetical protein [Couchioplanes caeruleus]ROP27641.1 hypothetical protein EDD30_0327 [Couchioplanes caeruleus]
MAQRQTTTAALAITATLVTLWGATPAAAALPSPPAQGVKMVGATYGHAYVVNDVAVHPARQWYAAGPGSNDSTGYIDYVIRTDIGRYTVWLPGLHSSGVAVITEVNGAGHGAYCGVTDVVAIMDRDVPGTDIEVACFSAGSLTVSVSPTPGGTPAGVAVNATFALTYTYLALTAPGRPPRSEEPSAYLRATRPTVSFYQPDLAYQYNSTGDHNTVERVGTGEYLVRLPTLDTLAGDAMVSGYGPGNHRCAVRDQVRSGAMWLVVVACRTAEGIPADVPFVLLRGA